MSSFIGKTKYPADTKTTTIVNIVVSIEERHKEKQITVVGMDFIFLQYVAKRKWYENGE